MKKSRLVVILGVLLSTSAVSDEYYFGGGVEFLALCDKFASEEALISTIYGAFGNKYNDYLSLEARAGIGITDDDIQILGVDVNRKLKSYYGVYFKGTIPVSDNFIPYVLVGYSGGEHEVSIDNYSDTSFESSFSYGAGLGYRFGDFSLNFEYMSYFDLDAAEVSGFGINLIKYF